MFSRVLEYEYGQIDIWVGLMVEVNCRRETGAKQ